MQNPFQTLGIPVASDTQTIRAAYHRLVKLCHPDIVQGDEQKNEAQDRLIKLNLAYREALRLARGPAKLMAPDPREESLKLANSLLARRMAVSAQRALERCRQESGDWYYLYGRALHEQGQYEAAHESFRQAVRRDPENSVYRMAALKSCVAGRNSRKPYSRVMSWVKHIGKAGRKRKA